MLGVLTSQHLDLFQKGLPKAGLSVFHALCGKCFTPALAAGTQQGSTSSMNIEDATVGERYLVELNDCCVAGSFTAVLTKRDERSEDNYHWVDSARFDNGVLLTEFFGVSLTPTKGAL
jgi:hypothetical protein